MRTHIWFPAALVAASLLFPRAAHAGGAGGTGDAKRGKFAGSVSIGGGPASQSGEIWQSSEKGGGDYVDTGQKVDTDASGDGKEHIANIGSNTLLWGHLVEVRFPGGVVCGPYVVNCVSDWFTSIDPGSNTGLVARVSQTVSANGETLLETWDPGAIVSLRLDTPLAQWQDLGVTLGSVDGDLNLALLAVTPQEILFQVLGDASPMTPNDVLIGGLGLFVDPSLRSVAISHGLQGTSSTFLNGSFLATTSAPTMTYFPADALQVNSPEPGSAALLALGLGLARRRQGAGRTRRLSKAS